MDQFLILVYATDKNQFCKDSEVYHYDEMRHSWLRVKVAILLVYGRYRVGRFFVGNKQVIIEFQAVNLSQLFQENINNLGFWSYQKNSRSSD